MTEEKVKPVCAHCGSDDVRCDGYTIWNNEKQEWELLATFDNTDCEKCEGECAIEWAPVEPDLGDVPRNGMA